MTIMKPKKLIGAISALALLGSAYACKPFVNGSWHAQSFNIKHLHYGDSLVHERPFNGATAIESEIPVVIDLYQADTPKLVLVAPSQTRLEGLKLSVQSGVLHISEPNLSQIDYDKEGVFRLIVHTPSPQRIKGEYLTYINFKTPIEVPTLDISVSTASSIRSQDAVRVGQIELDLSGASSVALPLIAGSKLSIDCSGAGKVQIDSLQIDELDIDCSGASSFALSGATKKLKVDLSGASKFKCETLYADTAEIEASGASSVRLGRVESLGYDVSGASSLHYSGTPRLLYSRSSGASSIKSY